MAGDIESSGSVPGGKLPYTIVNGIKLMYLNGNFSVIGVVCPPS